MLPFPVCLCQNIPHMSYHVEQHGKQLLITQSHELTAMMMLVFGLATGFGSFLFRSQILLQTHGTHEHNLLLWLLTALLILAGLLTLGGSITFFLKSHTTIDYTTDTVTQTFLQTQTIPFKAIEELTVRKHPRPTSNHLDKTLGESIPYYWTLSLKIENLKTDLMLLEVYSELDMRRFLAEITKEADWPVVHMESDE